MNMNPDNTVLRTASINANQEATSPDDERGFHLDLERYWLEARAVRYWLLGIVALALLAGLVVTLLMTSLYRANARIEVSQVTVNVTAIDTMKNDSRASMLQYLNTQYELLASRFMAARVADAGNLLRDEAFIDAAGLDQSQGLTEADIQNALLAGITITPIEQSSLVDIGYSARRPMSLRRSPICGPMNSSKPTTRSVSGRTSKRATSSASRLPSCASG